MTEYIEPTKRSKIRIVAGYAIGLLVYLIVRWAWEPFFSSIESRPLCDQLPWIRGTIVFFIGGALFLAVASMRSAVRVFIQRRHPVMGASVLFRTKVTYGARAIAFHALPTAMFSIAIVALVAFILSIEHVRVLFIYIPECGGA